MFTRVDSYSSMLIVTSHARLTLSVGGDDITEFLYVLLDRIGFPYKEFDLARSYDWAVMEDIKAEICTLSEVSRLRAWSNSMRTDGL